jgi:hypothetical protein
MVMRLLALLMAALVSARGAQAQDTWQTVTGPDGIFTIEMPGMPEYKTSTGKQVGTAFTIHTYIVDRGSNAFVVKTSLYPQDVDVSQPRRNLEAALGGSSEKFASGKWAKLTWLQYQGADAVEASGPVKPGLSVRSLVALKGRQVYFVGVVGPPDMIDGLVADRFFESLRLK